MRISLLTGCTRTNALAPSLVPFAHFLLCSPGFPLTHRPPQPHPPFPRCSYLSDKATHVDFIAVAAARLHLCRWLSAPPLPDKATHSAPPLLQRVAGAKAIPDARRADGAPQQARTSPRPQAGEGSCRCPARHAADGVLPLSRDYFRVTAKRGVRGCRGCRGDFPLSPHAPRRAGDLPPVPGSSRWTRKEKRRKTPNTKSKDTRPSLPPDSMLSRCPTKPHALIFPMEPPPGKATHVDFIAVAAARLHFCRWLSAPPLPDKATPSAPP